MIKFAKMFIIAALMFTIGLSLTEDSALAAEQTDQMRLIQLEDGAGSPMIRDYASTDYSNTVNGLFRKRYKGEVAEDPETGEYIAVVLDRRTGEREAVGTRDNEEEAQTLANIEANRRNGVMDGAGCNPPLVLC